MFQSSLSAEDFTIRYHLVKQIEYIPNPKRAARHKFSLHK